MYITAKITDGKDKAGNYRMKFQGKWLRNCKQLRFWFLWGDYFFDIREVRKQLDIDYTKTLDIDNLNIDERTEFYMKMQEIIDAVGSKDFETFLLEVVDQVELKDELFFEQHKANCHKYYRPPEVKTDNYRFKKFVENLINRKL